MPKRRPLKENADAWHVAQGIDQEGFDVLRHERRQDEQAPHAVDDAGHGGEQLDPQGQRAAKP